MAVYLVITVEIRISLRVSHQPKQVVVKAIRVDSEKISKHVWYLELM